MLEVRLHVVMGKAAVSVWCRSHGPEHCLWAGSSWFRVDSPAALLRVVAEGAAYAATLAHRGELEDLTDECGA